MLNRQLIKSDVRAYIRGRWFVAFLATLLISAIMGVVMQYLISIPYAFMMPTIIKSSMGGSYDFDMTTAMTMAGFAILIYLAMILVMIAVLPLYVSRSGYFLRLARGENPHLEDVVTPLKGRYFVYLGTALLKGIFVWLWSLLLYVPGIIMAIAYSFTYYIIAENPQIGAMRAITLSKTITRGHKGELFVLWLSFIGWGLLSLITVGVLAFYVQPYFQTTYAVYYEKLKEMAIAEGRVNAVEFSAGYIASGYPTAQ